MMAERERCKCVICPECGGSGDVWESITGEYIGWAHIDDLDHLITCPMCDGEGILEYCSACLQAEEEDREC